MGKFISQRPWRPLATPPRQITCQRDTISAAGVVLGHIPEGSFGVGRINGPGPWDQCIQGPGALGPMEKGPGPWDQWTIGPDGPGPWAVDPRAPGPWAQGARAVKHTSGHFLQFLLRNTRVTIAGWARYRSVFSILWCVSAHFHSQL